MFNESKVIPVGHEPPPLPVLPGTKGPPTAPGHDKTPPAKSTCRKTGDRFAVLNGFVDFTMGQLSRSEALTWLILYRDTKPIGLAQASQEDLARRAGVNVGTIKRAVALLRGRGLLTVVFRGNLRRGPSTYQVHPLMSSTDNGAPALPNQVAFCARNQLRRRAPSQKGPESATGALGAPSPQTE